MLLFFSPLDLDLIDPNLDVSCADWSLDGVFIALGGLEQKRNLGDKNSSSLGQAQVNIFNRLGELLTILRLNLPSISSISWNFDSTHLAIAAGSLLLTSKAQPMHKTASNDSTHVCTFTKDNIHYLLIWGNQMAQVSAPLLHIPSAFNVHCSVLILKRVYIIAHRMFSKLTRIS